MCGLHRLVDDRAQLAAERVQVDLVAQARRERSECRLGVVAAPVEPAIDERLNAPAGRAEERGDGEGRARDGQVVAPCEPPENLLKRQYDPEVERQRALRVATP